MAQLYSSQANIPQGAGAVQAPMGMVRMAGGEGEMAIGQTLADIGQQVQQVRDARAMAEGIAQYNAIVDEYETSLQTKDPSEHDFVGGFDKLQAKLGKITQGKSRAVQDELYNRFAVWNEEHKAGIARFAISKEVALTKDQLPDVRDNFLKMGLQGRNEYQAYLQKLEGKVLVKREIDGLMTDFDNAYAKMSLDAEADAVLGAAVNIRNEDGSIDTASAKKFISENKNLPNETKLDIIKKVTDWDSQEAIDNDK